VGIGLTRLARRIAAPCGIAILASLAVIPVIRAAAPAVSISPSSFNYGTVAVGSNTTQAFVLTNTGTADLHLQGVVFTGPNPSDFRISIAGCDYRTVPAGVTCTEYAVFAPKEAGALSAALTFPDDAAGSPQTVALTGAGTGPVVSYAPATLDFPQIPVGQQSAPQTFYVKDVGDSPLTITSATPQNGGVGALVVVSDGCSGTTIPAGANCRMVVAFRATQALSGGVTLTFQANTNPGLNNYFMSASGLGAYAQVYNPSFFGNQPQNSTSQPQYVQLQNAGGLPMQVGGVALSGAGAAQFAITSDACSGAAIYSGSPCRVFLSFTPTTTGTIVATITFTDDAPDSPQTSTIQGTGVAPGAIPSVTAIDFGVISDAGSASQVVQLANPTSLPLHVTSATISVGGSVFHTSVDSCTGATVAPATSCSLTVTFKPLFAYTGFTGTLAFSDDAGQQSVSLAGQGVDPQLSYAPDQINFGNQRVAMRSAPRAVTLTNTSGSSWTPQFLQLEANNFGVFGIDASGCAQTLAPGASCQVLLTFTPTGTVAFSALLDVYNPVTGSVNKLPVSGTGVAPVIPATSGILFGNQRVGTTLSGYSIGLANVGFDTLHVTSLSISGPNAAAFAIGATNCVGAAVAPNSSCHIPVSFTPSAVGSFSATLNVVDDAWNGPSQFNLSGTGVQAHASFSPSSVSFPNTLTGQSASQSISVMSDGTASLDVTSITLTGSGSAAYSVSADTCSGQQWPATIACSFNVTFSPQTNGSYPASVQIADDAAGSPQSISLTGSNLSSDAIATPGALSFGAVRPGLTGSPQTVTLTNDGGSTVQVVSTTLTGDPSFSLAADACSGTALATGSACTVQVAFAPTTLGTLSASLSFSDDAANSPQIVAASGSGVQPAVSLSPSSLAFGNQVLGTTSASQSVVVTNSGTDTLNVGTATVAAPFAMVADACSNTAVAAGSSCTIQVNFAPSAAGPVSASLSVPDDAPGSPQTVALSGNGIQPHATASPSTIAFGSVRVGSTANPRTVSLMNDGSTTIHVGATTLTGEPSFSLSADSCSGVTLPVGAACTVQVGFAPITNAGMFLATLSFNDDGGNSPQTVAISGTAVQPAVSLSASSLAFGSRRVGTTSATQSVVVTNTGSDTLNVRQVTVSAPFAIAADGCSSTAIAPGAGCTIQVDFAPIAIGSASGMLSIPDDAPGSPQGVVLTGTGVQPAASLSASSLAFGNQRVGTMSATQSVVVTNSGSDTLNVGKATVSAPFAIGADGCSNTAVAPGGNCTIQVAFAPSATGPVSGMLSIPDDAPGSPQTVALSGTGVQPLATVSPSSLSFGNVRVGPGSAAAQQYVTITNSGTADLHIASVTFAGDHAFTIGTGCSSLTLAPGASCRVGVYASPDTIGARSGTLQFADDAPGSPQVVTLRVTGLDGRLSAAPASIDFGSLRDGAKSSKVTIKVTNTGNVNLNISKVAITGLNPSSFAIASNSCSGARLAPGATCTVTVYFRPQTIGALSASLTFTNDGLGGAQSVSMRGTGLRT
jgi:hypothetical protein